MGPDAEVDAGQWRGFTRANLVAAAVFGAIVGLGIALRVMRFGVGDYYEDGASHWWAAAAAVETGQIQDTFNRSTDGAWLPGYDQVAVALFATMGTTDMVVLRLLGVAFFVSVELAILALALPAGRTVALTAAALMAVSPFDVLNAPIAIGMEPAVAFLCAGVALLRQSRAGPRTPLLGASIFFGLAVLFRYEAIAFVGVIIVYNWWWSGGRPLQRFHMQRELPYLVAPLLLAAIFLALTWGQNFPSRLFTNPPPELGSTEALGFIPQDPVGRNAEFWKFWSSAAPVAIALGWFGVARHFRRVEAWLVVVFSVLLALFLFLNLGTPSVRYLQPVEPMLWLMAALGGQTLMRSIARALSRLRGAPPSQIVRKGVAAFCVAALVGSTMATGAAAMVPVDQRIALHGPLFRAAAYLAQLPQDPSKLVLVDSPLAAEATGLPPARMIGSGYLPETREAALDYILGNVQYVLAVNVSYYPLIQYWPELGQGISTKNFSLLYDATGWEIEYSSKTAFVYRVNHGEGVVALSADLQVSFPFHAWDPWNNLSGVQLLYRGENLTAGAKGLGYPSIHANGRDYYPAAADGHWIRGTPTRGFQVVYTMYPIQPSGRLETALPKLVVRANYFLETSGFNATFSVDANPYAGNLTFRANNSLPDSEFPLTFNDSLRQRTSASTPDGLVWSLQNWFMGGRAAMQFDFRAPSVLYGGRENGKSAWIAYQAQPGHLSVAYSMFILPSNATLYDPDEPLFLRAPSSFAGAYLAGAPHTGTMRTVADLAFGEFPYLLDASGLPPERFAPSSEVPASRVEALAWIRANIEYVVVTNVTGDPILARFPELATGDSTREFSLVYDAGRPAGPLSEGLMWVYRPNGGAGTVRGDGGIELGFMFEQNASAAPIRGLDVLLNGTSITSADLGLGLPNVSVNGSVWAAGSAVFSFAPGSAGSAVESVFQFYPLRNGTADLSAEPLRVDGAYRFAGGLLNVSFTAHPLVQTDNVSVTAGFFVATADFPDYYNDTARIVLHDDVPRTFTWALRNWFIGPLGAIQADFQDPYVVFFSRESGGTSSFEYEDLRGASTISVSLWVVPAALAPTA